MIINYVYYIFNTLKSLISTEQKEKTPPCMTASRQGLIPLSLRKSTCYTEAQQKIIDLEINFPDEFDAEIDKIMRNNNIRGYVQTGFYFEFFEE